MNTVSTWLDKLSKALDSGTLDLTFQSYETFRPIVDNDSERQQILAEQALELMPRPMQTLLKALRDLKRDITVSECDTIDRRDSEMQANLNSAVAFTVKSMENLCTEITMIMSLDKVSDDLVNEVALYGVLSKPEEWLKDLDELLKKERLQVYEDLRETNVSRPLERPLRRINVDSALAAVAESQILRERLNDLNSGTLKSLRSTASVVSNAESNDDIEIGSPLSEPIKSTTKRPTIADITTCIRRVRREFDRSKMRQTVALDDIISACATALASESRLVKVRQPVLVFNVPESFHKADVAIQNEIKLLLGTLTVDRVALDQFLRSIRSMCESIKNSKERESSTSLRINLEQWQSQLQGVWARYVSTQRQYL